MTTTCSQDITALVLLTDDHPSRQILQAAGFKLENRADLYSLLHDLEQDPKDFALCVVEANSPEERDQIDRIWRLLSERAARVPRLTFDANQRVSEFRRDTGARVALRGTASKISVGVALDFLFDTAQSRFAA